MNFGFLVPCSSYYYYYYLLLFFCGGLKPACTPCLRNWLRVTVVLFFVCLVCKFFRITS